MAEVFCHQRRVQHYHTWKRIILPFVRASGLFQLFSISESSSGWEHEQSISWIAKFMKYLNCSQQERHITSCDYVIRCRHARSFFFLIVFSSVFALFVAVMGARGFFFSFGFLRHSWPSCARVVFCFSPLFLNFSKWSFKLGLSCSNQTFNLPRPNF